jgi:acyl-CoA reductase-like NAD-dependent aldehyde dehydrogenase
VHTAAAAPQLESFSPATGERLGAVAVSTARDVAGAVDQAATVQPLWATLRLRDRARYMARAAQAVIDEFDDLADLLGAEQGASPSRAPSTRSSVAAGATSRSASSASSDRRPSRSPRRWATRPWR